MENLEDEPGLTVTICLDEEGTKDSSNVSEEDIFGHIEQPSASKFVVPINPEIRISQLPAPIIRILGLRLNPPSIGTMRNWEYLAAILGMSLDEVAVYRNQSRPMETVLSVFGDTPFQSLLDSIVQVNRIDVLISLRPHLKHLDANLVKRSTVSDPLPAGPTQNIPGPSVKLVPLTLPNKFILVTHHEFPEPDRTATTDSAIDMSSGSSRSPSRRFRYLWKNLRKWGEQTGIAVIDINECLKEVRNINVSLHQYFNRATQIILIANEAYKKVICDSREHFPDPIVDLKRQLDELMQEEYVHNGRQNERFRVIVLDVCDKDYLPLGWPSSTIVYTFPENHADILMRIFNVS